MIFFYVYICVHVVFVLFYRENHADGKDDGSHIGDFCCNFSRFFSVKTR